MKNMTTKRWLLVGIVVALLTAAGLIYYFTAIHEAPLSEKSERRLLLHEDAEITKILMHNAYDGLLEVMRNGKHESINIRPSTEIYDQNGMRITLKDLSEGQRVAVVVENLVQYEYSEWEVFYVKCYLVFAW